MNKYIFNCDFLDGVISHIAAYDITIISMVRDGLNYIVQLENPIPPDEFIHLKDGYGLRESI